MLAGHLGAGDANGRARGATTAAVDCGGRGDGRSEDRCQIQNPNPRRNAARISPEIHFRRSRIEPQRFAT